MNVRFGNKKLIGQGKAKNRIEQILASERIGHAYLISGPAGSGKTAFALAFAEAINGISNITDLGEYTSSKKSSWFTHPGIHVFIPVPTSVDAAEIRSRLELLADDPYAVIDFALRPSLTKETSSKNLQAFYPIDYFREQIRPVTRLTPGEGNRVVVIMTRVETMRKETANAFLKLLEEPYDRVMFILTADNTEALLPTITSRCQHIRLATLTPAEIEDGLINIDGLNAEDAKYLANISGGNFSTIRLFDVEQMKQSREEIISFLRQSYAADVLELTKLIQEWQSSRHIEGLLSLLDLMEAFLRDLIVFRATNNPDMITNIDRLEVIRNFCNSLADAKLEEMMEHIKECRPMLRQNVSPKLVFTVLSQRFSNLMRGLEPVISENRNHLPAFVP